MTCRHARAAPGARERHSWPGRRAAPVPAVSRAHLLDWGARRPRPAFAGTLLRGPAALRSFRGPAAGVPRRLAPSDPTPLKPMRTFALALLLPLGACGSFTWAGHSTGLTD